MKDPDSTWRRALAPLWKRIAGDRGRHSQARRVTRATIAVAVLASLVTAVVYGAFGQLGASLETWVASWGAAPDPISISAKDDLSVSNGLFVPASQSSFAPKLLSGPQPSRLLADHDVSQPDSENVYVSIRDSQPSAVTLTGITFTIVSRRKPEAGRVYQLPIGGGNDGRYISVDMNKAIARIDSSSENTQALWGGPNTTDGSPLEPITFPWTISLASPLTLEIIAHATDCTCSWTASVDWQSGSQSGKLTVDNSGKPFVFVAAPDLQVSVPSENDKSWVPQGKHQH